MQLFPRLMVLSASSIDPTDAAEPEVTGVAFIFSWFGLVVEISLGRHV